MTQPPKPQLVVCGSHTDAQVPFEQVLPAAQLCVFAVCPCERSAPQPPQFCGSVLVVTQAPLHRMVPAAQLKPQVPPVQIAEPEPNRGPGQTWPQEPQFIGSLSVLQPQTPAVPPPPQVAGAVQVVPPQQAWPTPPQLQV